MDLACARTAESVTHSINILAINESFLYRALDTSSDHGMAF